MKPIGIYVRVSRRGDREDDRFHSPREQTERAERLARDKGYVVGPVYEDIDVSGGTAPEDRPAMGRLLEAIDAGELGGIAAYSLDRLSRDPAHGDSLVRRVTAAGGVLLSPDMPDAIDSPTGEFTFGMLLQVARLYRAQSRARFASAQEHATALGIPVGPVPFGYRQRADRVMEVDPAEAEVVRELYELRAQGVGPAALSRVVQAHLEASSREDRAGRRYGRLAVKTMLENEIYKTGRLRYGSFVSEVGAGAIVDVPLWEAAQRARMSRPRRDDSQWLLSGILRCSACGRNLHPHYSGGGSRYRRYICGNASCARKNRGVSALRIEAWVRDTVFDLLGSTLVERSTPKTEPLERALSDAERRVVQVMAEGVADDLGDLWAPEVRRRRDALSEAAAALGAARQVKPIPDQVRNLREEWEEMSIPERRDALAVYLIDAVYVSGTTREGWEMVLAGGDLTIR